MSVYSKNSSVPIIPDRKREDPEFNFNHCSTGSEPPQNARFHRICSSILDFANTNIHSNEKYVELEQQTKGQWSQSLWTASKSLQSNPWRQWVPHTHLTNTWQDRVNGGTTSDTDHSAAVVTLRQACLREMHSIGHFSHCSDQVPHKKQLRDRRVLFQLESEGTLSITAGSQGSGNMRKQLTLCPRSGSREEWMLVLSSSFSFSPGHDATHIQSPPPCSAGPAVSTLTDIPRVLSMVIPSPIKWV